jgi:DNA-directed RNA polymerase specialized sigma24 family protein
MAKKNPKHYVDNKRFLEELKLYRKSVQDAEADGAERPRIPNYIGECFLLIAQRLSYKPNFINYTFRDDMISDGIENCLLYIDNFNPEKSQNPFAYFTQIIYYAFLRRIQKEKRQTYIRYKSMERANTFGELADMGMDDSAEMPTLSPDNPMYQTMSEFIRDFEEANRKKREKRKKRGLDKFFEEDEGENSEDTSNN